VVKRPLWVTEWNNGANWTGCADPSFAQQEAAVQAMIDMLETTPFVERYALYNWVEDVRRVKWDDGSLTAAGVRYRKCRTRAPDCPLAIRSMEIRTIRGATDRTRCVSVRPRSSGANTDKASR
jgi:hypothetical protein